MFKTYIRSFSLNIDPNSVISLRKSPSTLSACQTITMQLPNTKLIKTVCVSQVFFFFNGLKKGERIHLFLIYKSNSDPNISTRLQSCLYRSQLSPSLINLLSSAALSRKEHHLSANRSIQSKKKKHPCIVTTTQRRADIRVKLWIKAAVDRTEC